MKWIILTTAILSTVSCGEIRKGDFCDLAEVLGTTDESLAIDIVERDVDLARGLNRHNRLVDECG